MARAPATRAGGVTTEKKKLTIVPRWTVPLDCAKRETRVLKSSDAAKRERVRPRNRVDRDARSCPRGHTVMLSFLAQTPALVASRIFSLSPRTPIHLIRYWSDLEVSHPGHGVTATPAGRPRRPHRECECRNFCKSTCAHIARACVDSAFCSRWQGALRDSCAFVDVLRVGR